MDLKKQIGNRIKESRKIAGYTQAETAKIFLMTQQQYSRFENGVYELNYAQLIAVCNLFEVSADYLLGLKNWEC